MKLVILITGTTSGLGKELLTIFSNLGHQVVSINRRNASDLEHQFPNQRFIVEDIRNVAIMKTLIERLQSQNLEPDIIILNAGINYPDNIYGLDTKKFLEVLDTNLMGNLAPIEAIQKMNLKNKKIITISSTSVVVPNAGSLAYSLGKQNLEQAFNLFEKCDPNNTYKYVRLGPMHSNLNRNLPPTEGFQKKIFSILSLDPKIVAEKVYRFSKNESKILHPSLFVYLFYLALSVALKVFPGIYYKAYQKKDS